MRRSVAFFLAGFITLTPLSSIFPLQQTIARPQTIGAPQRSISSPATGISPTTTHTTAPTALATHTVPGSIVTATGTAPVNTSVVLSPSVSPSTTATARPGTAPMSSTTVLSPSVPLSATATAPPSIVVPTALSLLPQPAIGLHLAAPWRRSGTLLPQTVTWTHSSGRYVALIGRIDAGVGITSTLVLSIPVPVRAISATLTLATLQHCTTLRPHSTLSLTLDTGHGARRAVQSIVQGCGRDRAWHPWAFSLARAISGTAVLTASATVAPHEAAALLLDAVAMTVTIPVTVVVPPPSTPTAATTALTGTATITATGALSTTTPTATASATTVPDLCVAPIISATYALELPPLTATTTPRPTTTATLTPTGTIRATATVTPTATRPWWRTVTATATPTPTGSPSATPGLTPTPGPSPTIGDTCHAVEKGVSFGFVAQEGLVNNPATPVVASAATDAILASGARQVRLDLHLVHGNSWSDREYASYDAAVNTFQGAHIAVLGLIGPGAVELGYNPNAWLVNSYERGGGNGDNPFLHRYAAQVLAIVGHFHGRITTWELWNEPNVGHPGTDGTYMFPSNFAAMLADTYTLVKATYPDVTIVSGGILSDDDGGHSTPRNAGADYLRQTYYMGLQVTHTWDAVRAQFGTTPLDVIGQHLYLDQSGLVYAQHIIDAYRWLHDAYGAFGDGGKEIYMTEGAWSTAAVSPATQALNLDILLSMSQSPVVPYVRRVYWYLLRDDGDSGQQFGLQSQYGASKQSYFHFINY